MVGSVLFARLLNDPIWFPIQIIYHIICGCSRVGIFQIYWTQESSKDIQNTSSKFSQSTVIIGWFCAVDANLRTVFRNSSQATFQDYYSFWSIIAEVIINWSQYKHYMQIHNYADNLLISKDYSVHAIFLFSTNFSEQYNNNHVNKYTCLLTCATLHLSKLVKFISWVSCVWSLHFAW